MPSSYAVEAQDENDIVNAVKFATDNNLRLVIKGTGNKNIFLLFNIPYARHYKPRLVYFFTPFQKTIYVL